MLIEVLTRCFRRPNFLAVNRASLAAQTDNDYIQTLLVDDVGRGIAWSYENLAAYAPKLTGEYIWILDDDDQAVSQTLIADLKAIAKAHSPDVIMLKMDHGELGVLPNKCWHKQPELGGIGCSAFVVKRQIWQRHAKHFGSHYAGDFDFIASIFARDYEIYWFDCVASRIQRRSLGAVE